MRPLPPAGLVMAPLSLPQREYADRLIARAGEFWQLDNGWCVPNDRQDRRADFQTHSARCSVVYVLRDEEWTLVDIGEAVYRDHSTVSYMLTKRSGVESEQWFRESLTYVRSGAPTLALDANDPEALATLGRRLVEIGQSMIEASAITRGRKTA